MRSATGRMWIVIVAAWGACRCGDTPSAPRISVAGREREERCLTCHQDTRGIGSAHEPQTLGCSPCHGGDPKARVQEAAHRGMHVVTGELSQVSATCGQVGCHPVEAARVQRSPMTTAAGIVAIDKFAFGEREEPVVHARDAIDRLPDTPASPAEDHVRKLCASCHLGLPKEEPGDHGFFARGGGCTACHLGAPLAAAGAATAHPSVTSDVSEHHCRGCHARSGRIALSFRGLAETEAARADTQLPDGRSARHMPPDVHARRGMTCIDCHSERDVMGDGEFHAHASEAVEVRCEDCHARELHGGPPAPEAQAVALRLARSWQRRGLPALEGRSPIVMARGTPLYRSDTASRSLLLAASGQQRSLPTASAAAYHTLPDHGRLSCQACHSPWAPRCGKCHTTYAAEETGFDALLSRDTPGAWHEQAGDNGVGLPALALDAQGRIVPFIEGMQLRVAGVGEEEIARTLWAPLDPHTTGPARPCSSCHGSAPDAVHPVFPAQGQTTRVGARLFDPQERERIARVGRCLACHDRYEDPIYGAFDASLSRLAARAHAAPGDPVARCRGDAR